MALGDPTGCITIEALDSGGLSPYPRITFSPVGNITSGWLDKHGPLIQRAVEQEQARIRHSLTPAQMARNVTIAGDGASSRRQRRA